MIKILGIGLIILLFIEVIIWLIRRRQKRRILRYFGIKKNKTIRD